MDHIGQTTELSSDVTHTATTLNEAEKDSWQRARERLRAEVGDEVFVSWFARMEIKEVGSEIVKLSVATKFLKSWIESHYSERLFACLQAEFGTMSKFEITVRSGVLCNRTTSKKMSEVVTKPNGNGGNGHAEREPNKGSVTDSISASHAALGGSPLDPRLTFDTFVVGRSNSLAHAAAKQIAQARPGDAIMFNPLFVHAGVGLGKTHLLQSLVWACSANSARKAIYLTAERFMYGFVAALRAQNSSAFRDALRTIDVIIIDDLQFLQGKSTQVEFCHTLNACIDAGRQVVIAADRPPADLESLDERVLSRLVGGLVVEMSTLGEDTRLEILKILVDAAKIYHPGFNVPPSVLAFIANTVTFSGRDLEGALNRILAHSQLTSSPVTLEMAEREVRDLIRPKEPKRIKIEEIQRAVARQYNVSRADLLSSRRTANVVRPRQVAMYLAKTLTLRSLPEIGRRFGGRDHTTVLHAVRKIENLVHSDSALAEEIELLKRQLQN